MSHLSKIEIEVTDLNALAIGCKRLGLELNRGKQKFLWYGEPADCSHAIKVPGARYEIGLIRKERGHELMCDYYDSAIGQAIGKNGGKLKQAYAVEKAKLEARRKGYSVVETENEKGIRLRIIMDRRG